MSGNSLSRSTPRWALSVALLGVCLLSACARGGNASVNIHGVNYTDEEFSYRVEDPLNKDNHGGGELVGPFAAGGTLCCYELPRTWRPGIQVQIHSIRWKEKVVDDPSVPLEEIREMQQVEVPAYADGKPGELWVLRNADGTFAVVSSDLQPDHAKWPGAVKGWPVPTVAYRRKRFDLYIKVAQDSLDGYLERLEELNMSPGPMASRAWAKRQENIARYADSELRTNIGERSKKDRELLAKFTGPTDPGFIELMKEEYREAIRSKQKSISELKEARP